MLLVTLSFGEKKAIRKTSIESVRAVGKDGEDGTELIMTSGQSLIVSEYASDILDAIGGCDEIEEKS